MFVRWEALIGVDSRALSDCEQASKNWGARVKIAVIDLYLLPYLCFCGYDVLRSGYL